MATEQLPVLAVDFDDIIAGFNIAYPRWHDQHYGTNVSQHPITSFNMLETYGVTPDQLSERTRQFVHHFHDEIPIHEGVQEYIPRLAEEYRLHIVTSRCESLRGVTSEWLESYDLIQHFSALHFTNGFNSLYPDRKRSKAEVCQTIGAFGLVEDAIENAIIVADAGIHVLLLERDWNRNAPAHDLIRPCRNWSDVESLAFGLANTQGA